MLRTVKSLPSLRVLNIAATKVESTSSIQRAVHSSSKQNQTTLLNTKKSEFSLMSLNTLKTECRKRGLKVSGRKADLVSRVIAHESSFTTQSANSINTTFRPKNLTDSKSNDIKIESPFKRGESVNKKPISTNAGQDSGVSIVNKKLAKTFTNSAAPNAKDDDSHIDFIKPVDFPTTKAVNDDYITQIPSLSAKASETPVTPFEKLLKKEPVNPNSTIISKAEGSDSKIFENSSIDQIDIQNEQASRVTAEVFDEGKQEEGPYKWENSEFSGKDKTTLFSVLAAVGLWWSLKPKTDLEKKH